MKNEKEKKWVHYLPGGELSFARAAFSRMAIFGERACARFPQPAVQSRVGEERARASKRVYI